MNYLIAYWIGGALATICWRSIGEAENGYLSVATIIKLVVEAMLWPVALVIRIILALR